MKIYFVYSFLTELQSTRDSDLKIKFDGTDGLIGAMPIFKTKKKAEKFSQGRYHIVEGEIKKIDK